MKTKLCKILGSISLGFVLIIAACGKKEEECTKVPTAINTLKISAFEFEQGRLNSKPLPDIPFQITKIFCNDLAQSPSDVRKSEILRTNEKGELNLTDTTFKDVTCGFLECKSQFRFLPLSVQFVSGLGYVFWEEFENSDRKIYLFKKSFPLKLEVKINKPEVKLLSITPYQGNPRRDFQGFATTNNGQNATINTVFYVPKGEDIKLEIKFDNVLYRKDTIKQTQRDTIFVVITM